MSNILISSAGKRVELVKAFKKELQLICPNSKVYSCDSNPELSAACEYSKNWFKVPRISEPNYFEVLLDNCLKYNIKLIIPTIDTELLVMATKKNLFLKNNIIPIVSSVSFIKKCKDKREIHNFFKNKSIETAKEYSKKNYILPLYLKPYIGSRSIDNFIIKSEEEFLKRHFKNDIMFLEYLDPNKFQEYTCDLYYSKDHHLKCVVPRKRIEVRDGEVNKGKTEKNILVNFIKVKLSFIDGAIGCLTAQFFLNKETDKIIGIEINPRFGGGYPLSYKAGANYPKWIIQEYLLSNQIKPFDSWHENLLMLRFDKGIYKKNVTNA